MPNNVQELELVVTPLDVKRKRVLRVPIDFLRDCLPRSTRIDVITEFKDEKTMILDIRDAGFGELNESTGARLVQEVNLWD